MEISLVLFASRRYLACIFVRAFPVFPVMRGKRNESNPFHWHVGYKLPAPTSWRHISVEIMEYIHETIRYLTPINHKKEMLNPLDIGQENW